VEVGGGGGKEVVRSRMLKIERSVEIMERMARVQ